MCSRSSRDDAKLAYRLDDDPHTAGIRIDVPDADLRGLELRGLHRYNLILKILEILIVIRSLLVKYIAQFCPTLAGNGTWESDGDLHP